MWIVSVVGLTFLVSSTDPAGGWSIFILMFWSFVSSSIWHIYLLCSPVLLHFFPWMTHVEPLREGSRGPTKPKKPWLLRLQLFPGHHYWQVATPFWRALSSPLVLGYMLLNLPIGMFHKRPAGKSKGAKRKVRGLNGDDWQEKQRRKSWYC